MRKIITYFIFFLTFSLSFIGCSNEDVKLPDIDTNSTLLSDGIPTSLSFTFEETTQMGIPVETKASVTEEERTIHNIWILQFDGTEPSSQLLTRQYAVASNFSRIYLSSNTILSENRLVIIANTFDVETLSGLTVKKDGTAGITYSEFITRTASTDKMLKNIASHNNAIPMYGEVNIPRPALDGTTNATIHLHRSVAKVTMNLSLDAVNYPYDLDSIYVFGIPTQSYYYPNIDGLASGTEYPSSDVPRDSYWAIKVPDSNPGYVEFYLPINIQPSLSVDIEESQRRVSAPAHATYMAVCGDRPADAALVWYYKYIGAGKSSNPTTQDLKNYTILPNHQYNYNYKIVGHNIGSSTNIEKSEICNSYCLTPHKNSSDAERTIEIDVAEMVNRYWKKESMRVRTVDNLTMEVIWKEGEPSETTPSTSVSLSNPTISRISGTTKFTVTIPTSQWGNYLIGVKKTGRSEYLWSYHIWCSGNDPRNETMTMPSGAVLMRRNIGATWEPTVAGDRDRTKTHGWIYGVCGAVNELLVTDFVRIRYCTYRTFGVYFQWGRKDPLQSNHTSTLSSESSDYSFTTSNPKSFITANGAWNADSHLWKDALGRKTMFDPCPKGWKVPDNTAWNNVSSVSSTSFNYIFKKSLDVRNYDYTFYAGNILFYNGSHTDPNYSGMNLLPTPGYIDNSGATRTNKDDETRDAIPTGKGIYWTNSSSGAGSGSCLLINNTSSSNSSANTIGLSTYSKMTGGSIRCQKM